MKEKKLYMIAIVGAIICFIGDNLLGFFKPAADFGNKFLCITFSYDLGSRMLFSFFLIASPIVM